MAALFYPGRARCLEQSLALYVLLRRRGVPAELKLGVQPYPFNAHAWVELNGSPLNERLETVRQFVPLPGLRTMNLFLTALRPTGEPVRKTDLFAFLARLPRNVEFESVIEGPFAVMAATGSRTRVSGR